MKNSLAYIIHSAQKKGTYSCTPARNLLPLRSLIIKVIDTFQCAKVIQKLQMSKYKQTF